MILPRILAETSRITEHGGSARACDGAEGRTGRRDQPSRRAGRARLEVDCQWQVRATVRGIRALT